MQVLSTLVRKGSFFPFFQPLAPGHPLRAFSHSSLLQNPLFAGKRSHLSIHLGQSICLVLEFRSDHEYCLLTPDLRPHCEVLKVEP